MNIIAQCPKCQYSFLLDVEAADRRLRCTNCHRLFKIPKLQDMPRAVKIIENANGKIYVDQNGKTYG